MSITKLAEAADEQSQHLVPEPIDADHDDNNESYRHPLGLRPSGNALGASDNAASRMGHFAQLPDALILTVLEYLDQHQLTNLANTCRGLFAYCSYDQLWRDLAVNLSEGSQKLCWRGSWRATLRKLPNSRLPRIDCRNVFSDALHRPFFCSRIDLDKYASKISATNAIPRLRDLDTDEFNKNWTTRPFILTEPVRGWNVFQSWSLESFAADYADVKFRAEAVDWPAQTYLSYLRTTADESPLYLFDRSFVEKMHLKVDDSGDYEPPSCFQQDLFSVLGNERPDYRWLIIGPERSGSTFHKDPNATSAWNAVIRGAKYWIMFPPSIIPPGVYMSEDQSEVTSPLSIAEWLLTFHEEAKTIPGCIEGVCEAGEVLHVPSGWWHLVVNLEPSIAITQNFVPASHIRSVVHFLDHKKQQVSGFKDDITDPLTLFIDRLHEQYPEVAATLDVTKKRKWEEVVAESVEAEAGGFSFGFGDDVDSEED